MIGLILGTSEGKNIVSLLNEFTDDLFITTATSYGGELLKEFKYKELNSKPLAKEELKEIIQEKNINIIIDATHPYAVEITKMTKSICRELSIDYLRYERASVIDKYKGEKNIVLVDDYEGAFEKFQEIEGTVLNTTGSRNLDKFVNSDLNNRVIHRVLPSVSVMERCIGLGIDIGDIVAMKGPIGYDLNRGFINEYSAVAMILKDSGVQGGTEEKVKAALDSNILAIVIKRADEEYSKVFNKEKNLVDFIYNNYFVKGRV
ncbi:cobalt-precorrin-6A reductase [Clostridium sediminicola]|uniref:cobalt-precorrin-6A reductase n=1 Tax=Clostridium sediminicola TaxID=3114879 RepID=UPI0031F22844